MEPIWTYDTIVSIDEIPIRGITESGVPFPDYGTFHTTIEGNYIKDDAGQTALIDAVNDGHYHFIKIELKSGGIIFDIRVKVTRVKTYSEDLCFKFKGFLEDVEILSKINVSELPLN